MTTEEFAAIIVDALHEQNYFKKGIKSHPADIAISFSSTAETIAATMDWAIRKEFVGIEKKGIEKPSNDSDGIDDYNNKLYTKSEDKKNALKVKINHFDKGYL